MHEVDRTYRQTNVSALMQLVLSPSSSAEQRYTSLWDLWELVERTALSVGVDRTQLRGSPFLPTQID